MQKIDVKAYLFHTPQARERKNKYRAIGNIILKQYGLDIPKDKMAEIVADAVSGDRHWRKVTEENPELRGTDYYQKDQLEENFIKTL